MSKTQVNRLETLTDSVRTMTDADLEIAHNTYYNHNQPDELEIVEQEGRNRGISFLD